MIKNAKKYLIVLILTIVTSIVLASCTSYNGAKSFNKAKDSVYDNEAKNAYRIEINRNGKTQKILSGKFTTIKLGEVRWIQLPEDSYSIYRIINESEKVEGEKKKIEVTNVYKAVYKGNNIGEKKKDFISEADGKFIDRKSETYKKVIEINKELLKVRELSNVYYYDISKKGDGFTYKKREKIKVDYNGVPIKDIETSIKNEEMNIKIELEDKNIVTAKIVAVDKQYRMV